MLYHRVKPDWQIKEEVEHFLEVLVNSEYLDEYFKSLILTYLDILERERNNKNER